MVGTDMVPADRCGRCGTTFFEAATPEGLCPHCLFDVAESWDPDVDLRRAFPQGTRLGRYEIESSLGEGGMGEVYRARDLRLGRTVAIKVLPAELSGDPTLRRRLEREAQLASSLNHPHICRLFDLGEEDGVAFLVMEYLEGETLLERLRRGPLPIEQVLQHAVAIAAALEEAHRHGVIHRDLKPGNIMLTASGAKLLDFGLAKLHAAAPAALLSAVPVAAGDAPLSGERTVVGTIRYMSPEQLEGRDADPRSDLFSLGLLIYEMATGRPAVAGESDASVMVALLSAQPARMSSLGEVPEPLAHILETCLSKNPDDRWQTAKDILLQLKWMSPRAATPDRDRGSRRFRHVLVPEIVAAFALTVTATLWSMAPSRASSAGIIRFSLAPPAASAYATLSPDGSRYLWVAQDSGRSRLFVQTLDSMAATELEGTEGVQCPSWSPDSATIGFFADGKLKRIPVSGGVPVAIAAAPYGLGAAWNRDGTIIFAPDKSGGLMRTSLGGGPATLLTTVNRAAGETSHRWPVFLPDGRHFLFLAIGSARGSGVIHLGSLDSTDRTALAQADSGPAYSAAGYVLFVLKGTLMAQRFDGRSRRVRDDPIPVARNVANDPVDGSTRFSASDTGVLLYHTHSVPESRLVWFDRAGRSLGALVVPGLYGDPTISPDSTAVAFAQLDMERQTSDIWRLDLARGGMSRVTASNTMALRPVWSPDSDQILFSSKRDLTMEMFRVAARGGQPERLQDSATNQTPSDWRLDGRYILYENADPRTRSDIWVLPQQGNRTPIPYLRTPFNETRAKFSPDGRWVSYTSDESGTSDVYIQSFPVSRKKWQVSVRGGSSAIWRRDGKEIFYIAPDRRLMAVQVLSKGSTIDLGPATPLFQVPDGDAVNSRFSYAASADGQRFLVNVVTREGPIRPLTATVVVNWRAALPR